jgi:type VI protein secretion system component VasF
MTTMPDSRSLSDRPAMDAAARLQNRVLELKRDFVAVCEQRNDAQAEVERLRDALRVCREAFRTINASNGATRSAESVIASALDEALPDRSGDGA